MDSETESRKGRPSEYNLEAVDRICDGMLNGKGLLKICSEPDMPNRSTVYRWLDQNEDFRKRFARAREAQMDYYAEQILAIAFDESGDIIYDQEGEGTKAKTKAVANHAKVQRDRLKVDSLKWTASRLFPKRYGDKMELLAQTDEPSEMKISWQVDRIITGVPRAGGPGPPKPSEPPRQIPYSPWKPPADLTPEAWSAIARVSDLIEQIAPGDEKPEHVFGLIEGWLRAHFLGAEAA